MTAGSTLPLTSMPKAQAAAVDAIKTRFAGHVRVRLSRTGANCLCDSRHDTTLPARGRKPRRDPWTVIRVRADGTVA